MHARHAWTNSWHFCAQEHKLLPTVVTWPVQFKLSPRRSISVQARAVKTKLHEPSPSLLGGANLQRSCWQIIIMTWQPVTRGVFWSCHQCLWPRAVVGDPGPKSGEQAAFLYVSPGAFYMSFRVSSRWDRRINGVVAFQESPRLPREDASQRPAAVFKPDSSLPISSRCRRLSVLHRRSFFSCCAPSVALDEASLTRLHLETS